MDETGNLELHLSVHGSIFLKLLSMYTNKTARKHYRASVHHCLQEKAPRYLVDCGTPVSESLAIDYYGQPVDTKSAALPVEHVLVYCGLFSPWSYFVELFTRSSP